MLALPKLSLPAFEPGQIWLCGAGPGDPGLLTLNALEALRRCDCVVYDSLVHESVLDLAPAGAERIFAGKRGGKPSFKQRDISEKLITLARARRRVLRLKGGDPLTFARGGEEALALIEAGIDFHIIAGVSAVHGACAEAGIPLTHRSTNSSVLLLTGHDLTGRVPLALGTLAAASVIVIYMALLNIGELVDRLLASGRVGSEKIVFMSRSTTPEARYGHVSA